MRIIEVWKGRAAKARAAALEEAAKEADAYGEAAGESMDPESDQHWYAARQIAANIRALATKAGG